MNSQDNSVNYGSINEDTNSDYLNDECPDQEDVLQSQKKHLEDWDFDSDSLNEKQTLKDKAFRFFDKKLLEELKLIFNIAWPTALTYFFRFFTITITMLISGRLSSIELDTIALSNSVINVFGLSIGMGLTLAMDTILSHTYGRGNKMLLGILLQRYWLIMTFVFLVISSFFVNIERILVYMKQSPIIAKMTARFILFFLPGLWCDFSFITFARYLLHQGIVIPGVFCSLGGMLFNAVSQYIAIRVLEYDYQAAAVCQAGASAVMFALMLAYVLVSGIYKETWSGLNLDEALREWGSFFRLGIPGICLNALETWFFEIVTFVAGSLSISQLGGHGINFQIETIFYLIPRSIAIAVNTRVGQQLGAKLPKCAKKSYNTGVFLVLCTATLASIFLISLNKILPLAFSSDPKVIKVASQIMYVLAFFQYVDGLIGVSEGALLGCGRQMILAVFIFLGYYAIALPVGLLLTFVAKMKVFGMWLGLILGVSIEAISFTVLVHRTKWEDYTEIEVGNVKNHAPRKSSQLGCFRGESVSLNCSESCLCVSKHNSLIRRVLLVMGIVTIIVFTFCVCFLVPERCIPMKVMRNITEIEEFVSILNPCPE